MGTIDHALALLKICMLCVIFVAFLNSCGMMFHPVSLKTTGDKSIITQKKPKLKPRLEVAILKKLPHNWTDSIYE